MTGSLDSIKFFQQNFSSQQTFTFRKIKALRLRQNLQYDWNANTSTTINLMYRNNTMDQNPAYLIASTANATKFKGQVNSNHFDAYVLDLQHIWSIPLLSSKIMLGGYWDITNQNLIANYTNNIVASIFGNNPNIYWGFTAATGGANNLQRFRVNSLEISLGDQIICSNDTILVSSQVNTSAYSYLWSPNYNITNNTLPSTTFFPDTTNLYVLEVTNSYGCSITDSFTVFVNPTTTNILTQVACDSYFWPANGQTYTSSGNYVYISTNSSGCQQVDSLYLTINNSSSTVSAIAECDIYVWPLNGQVYTTSGLYTDTSTNSSGCLQTDTLDLTINYSSYTTISIISCDTFFWPINGITYFC